MSLTLGNIWTQKRTLKTAYFNKSKIGLNNMMIVRKAEISQLRKVGTKGLLG